jgi:hypothetical protein
VNSIGSGKELCDGFFAALVRDKTIDPSITGLLYKLYSEGGLTRDAILKGLEALRENGEDDTEG